MNDDGQLLRRYAENGDESAFSELVRRYLGLAYHTALRHLNGDTHGAKDVAQEVFTLLARKAKSLLHYPTLGGWLYAQARYGSLQALRTQGRRQTREGAAQTMNEITFEPNRIADLEHLGPLIDQALSTLGERDRVAIYLRFFEEQPFAEAGAKLGLSEEAMRKRTERAVEKLQASLRRLGVTSTAAALAGTLTNQASALAPVGLAESIAATALVAARTLAASAFGPVQFMTSSNFLTGAAVTAGLIVAGFSFHEQNAIRETREALARTARELGAASVQLQSLRKHSLEVDQMLLTLQSREAKLRASLPKKSSSAASSPVHRVRVATTDHGRLSPLDQEISRNPAVRKYTVGFFGALGDFEYGPLFQRLGLTAEQITAFRDLNLQLNHLDEQDYLTLRSDDVSLDQVRQSIASVLGPENYQQYIQYSQSVGIRFVASALAGNLYDSGSPLTGQQADQLTQILAASNLQGSGRTMPESIDWAAALPQAQTFLSPSQFSVLQNLAAVMTPDAGTSPWAGLRGIIAGSTGNGRMPIPLAAALNPRK